MFLIYLLFQTVPLAFVFKFLRLEKRGYILPRFGMKTKGILVWPTTVGYLHLIWCSVFSLQKEAPSGSRF